MSIDETIKAWNEVGMTEGMMGNPEGATTIAAAKTKNAWIFERRKQGCMFL